MRPFIFVFAIIGCAPTLRSIPMVNPATGQQPRQEMRIVYKDAMLQSDYPIEPVNAEVTTLREPVVVVNAVATRGADQ